MECLHGKPASSSKTENGLFFTVGKSLAVISFAPRMIAVILKQGRIQTDATDANASVRIFRAYNFEEN